jgi:hypothetical protein
MTNQMKRVLTRVDGITAPVGPIHIFGPESAPAESSGVGATRRARDARGRADGLARTRAAERRGRLPRALEALWVNEPIDLLIHQDLAASGLL